MVLASPHPLPREPLPVCPVDTRTHLRDVSPACSSGAGSEWKHYHNLITFHKRSLRNPTPQPQCQPRSEPGVSGSCVPPGARGQPPRSCTHWNEVGKVTRGPGPPGAQRALHPPPTPGPGKKPQGRAHRLCLNGPKGWGFLLPSFLSFLYYYFFNKTGDKGSCQEALSSKV